MQESQEKSSQPWLCIGLWLWWLSLPSLVHRGEAVGGGQLKVGEEDEDKGNCWNWGELPCDNLGTEDTGMRANPPRSGEGGGSSLAETLCKQQQHGLERSLKWCYFPLFFTSLTILHSLLHLQGQQLPRARAETQPSCTEKGILPFFVMHKMTFRYLDRHGSHLILHAC